jgi:hypothetical protein
LGCVARHVLMTFLPKSKRLEYMTQLCRRYSLDLEALKTEVTAQHQAQLSGRN